MKVSAVKCDQHRDAIERAAAALFRQRGIDDVSVAEVMQAAGMTHGGFYRHFSSKAELAAAACKRAHRDTAEVRAGWIEAGRDAGTPLRALFRNYLSDRHRDRTAQGCPIAALLHDAMRQPASSAMRQEYLAGMMQVVKEIGSYLPGVPSANRQQALACVATMVGALTLARASRDDQDLSHDILQAAQAFLTQATKFQQPMA